MPLYYPISIGATQKLGISAGKKVENLFSLMPWAEKLFLEGMRKKIKMKDVQHFFRMTVKVEVVLHSAE